MDTIQCAVVLAKLQRFDWEIQQRIALGNRYNELMSEAGIEHVKQKQDRTSVFAQYTILVQNREKLQEKLASQGIPTAVHYPIPLNQQEAYKGYRLNDTQVSQDVSKMVMSLPMHPNLSFDDLDDVVSKLCACSN